MDPDEAPFRNVIIFYCPRERYLAAVPAKKRQYTGDISVLIYPKSSASHRIATVRRGAQMRVPAYRRDLSSSTPIPRCGESSGSPFRHRASRPSAKASSASSVTMPVLGSNSAMQSFFLANATAWLAATSRKVLSRCGRCPAWSRYEIVWPDCSPQSMGVRFKRSQCRSKPGIFIASPGENISKLTPSGHGWPRAPYSNT